MPLEKGDHKTVLPQSINPDKTVFFYSIQFWIPHTQKFAIMDSYMTPPSLSHPVDRLTNR